MKGSMMEDSELQIPPAWQTLPLASWRRPVVVLGATDTGKSTLCQWLYRRLRFQERSVAYLDLDPGQNDLGPPATLALGLPRGLEAHFPPNGPRWLYFLGSNTPRGHLLRQLAGLTLLQRLAERNGHSLLLVNTSGFVTGQHGGRAIKWGIIELLRPCHVIGLQRNRELESLLRPLRRFPEVEVVDLPVVAAVRRRDLAARQRLRAERYLAYFQQARCLPLAHHELAVFPRPTFMPGQLVALEDSNGLTLALAVVEQAEPPKQVVHLQTPWPGTPPVSAVRLGSLKLDLSTGTDSPWFSNA